MTHDSAFWGIAAGIVDCKCSASITVFQQPSPRRRRAFAGGAIDLGRIPDSRVVRTAGALMVRKHPGSAKGFVFLSFR
ncbi:MAG: hypothetical protein EXQ52_16840 [Bryobacterales bacterium]|nr:hypothetical protein [Bryobacterales bacterium]